MVFPTLSLAAWLAVVSGMQDQSPGNPVPSQDAGFSAGIDTRQWPLILTPLTLPPAEEAYRGLRASIDAVFHLSFVDGEVTKVELESAEVRTPHDPLPAWFDLLDADSIRSWGNYALQHWRSLQRLPFEWRVRVRFQSNAALAEDEVRYSVVSGTATGVNIPPTPCRWKFSSRRRRWKRRNGGRSWSCIGRRRRNTSERRAGRNRPSRQGMWVRGSGLADSRRPCGPRH